VDVAAVRGQCRQSLVEDALQEAQAIDVDVNHRDHCPHAQGNARCVGAYGAAAEDHHAAGPHAGHAPEQHAATSLLLFQQMRTDLHRHLACDLAHGR